MKRLVPGLVLILAACSPTLQGVPPDLYSRPGYVYVLPPPKQTPVEELASDQAYYGAVWYAHCRGMPRVDATPGCQFLKRNGTLPWVAERDFCCLREP